MTAMPPKITKTSGNKRSCDNRKTSLWSSRKGHGTSTDPLNCFKVLMIQTNLPLEKTNILNIPACVTISVAHRWRGRAIPIKQSTAGTPTNTMMSVPIKTVPPAKVLIDDLVNFSLRPGLPNPLKVAAEGNKLSAELKHKRQPHPPDVTRVLTQSPLV